jgi:iron(III) transport system substrate-binding protein
MNDAMVKAWAASLLLSLSAAVPALAQSQKAQATVAEIARYQGPDRLQRLVDGAKKEGGLTYYQSRSDIGPALDAFTKKYGIKVESWRASGETVLQKILSESRAGRWNVDIVETGEPQLEALRREKLLQPVNSPFHGELMSQAVPPHKEWAATTFDIFVAAYNTDKVKREDLPKTYHDLLDPKWRGLLGVEAEDHPWFATLMQLLGEEKGRRLFRDIVASNGMSVRKGHTLLANLVGSGEIPLGLTVYNYSPEQMRQKGVPIDSFVIPPAVGKFVSIGLLKNAPRPHAALLFYDFMLYEGQQILAKRHYIATNDKIGHPLKKLPVTFIDPALSIDMNDKWVATYEGIFMKKTK